ncbi:unnamed protein product [Urochloa decumbens]|uniref:PDZ domain-containing protein n=1 Tax=Urochloa decumbens TaxID=240449 RepID=A0ABC9EEY5_9POAL
MPTGGGDGSPPEQEGATRTRFRSDSSDSEPQQRVPLPSRRRKRTHEESDSGLEPRTNRRRASGSQEGKRRGEKKMKRQRRTTTTGEGSKAAVEKDTDSSSEYSSPIRRPVSLMVDKITSSGDVVQVYNSDPAAVDAYHKDFQKYQKKLARLQELPTLKQCKHALNITDWHDVKKKNAVLDVAESVLSISSFLDGKEISRCSGVIIEWVEINRSAIVVTSSQIICTKISFNDWEDNNVYAPNCKLHRFFFRRTTVKALDPLDHQKNHYLFIGGKTHESPTGGALADFDRNVLGMVVDALPNIAFIPSYLIIKCLRLWQKFKKVARPHLGLKLRSVEFLDISHLDQLSRDHKIRSGLIVGKVSSRSLAESNGIRVGDVIFSCQGEVVSTISQFEGILLDVCLKQFEAGNGLNSKVDVELGVYKLRKLSRRMVTLSVELSDSMEAFDY